MNDFEIYGTIFSFYIWISQSYHGLSCSIFFCLVLFHAIWAYLWLGLVISGYLWLSLESSKYQGAISRSRIEQVNSIWNFPVIFKTPVYLGVMSQYLSTPFSCILNSGYNMFPVWATSRGLQFMNIKAEIYLIFSTEIIQANWFKIQKSFPQI